MVQGTFKKKNKVPDMTDNPHNLFNQALPMKRAFVFSSSQIVVHNLFFKLQLLSFLRLTTGGNDIISIHLSLDNLPCIKYLQRYDTY